TRSDTSTSEIRQPLQSSTTTSRDASSAWRAPSSTALSRGFARALWCGVGQSRHSASSSPAAHAVTAQWRVATVLRPLPSEATLDWDRRRTRTGRDVEGVTPRFDRKAEKLNAGSHSEDTIRPEAHSEPGYDFIQELHVQSVGVFAEFGNVQDA